MNFLKIQEVAFQILVFSMCSIHAGGDSDFSGIFEQRNIIAVESIMIVAI